MVVALLVLLSVSAHPAMAAEMINKETGGCPGCGPGHSGTASVPGLDRTKIPKVSIREISPEGRPSDTVSWFTGRAAAIGGARSYHPTGSYALDIRDPFSTSGEPSGIRAAAAGSDPLNLPDGIMRNMSRDGYDSTSLGTHRYESVITSEDFLTLNSSQKDALGTAGIVFTADRTIRTYRDVTIAGFTNRTTGSVIYLMHVQRLDAGGSPVGEPEIAISPEFSGVDGRTAMASSGTMHAISSYCAWEWFQVTLLTAGLIGQIAAILLGSTLGGVVVGILVMIGIIGVRMVRAWFSDEAHRFWLEARELIRDILIALVLIIPFTLMAYLGMAIYDLGVCMGWWDPIGMEELVWNYQHRFTETENGKLVPVELHDRFAVLLYADTRADKDARWDIGSVPPGLILRDHSSVRTENGTVRMWLVEAAATGNQALSFRYVTDKPVPPTVPFTEYTLGLSVSPGPWTGETIESPLLSGLDAKALSLAVDGYGTPHVSGYDAEKGRIIYATRHNGTWDVMTVADSAGTYATSIAVDRQGNPSISFGDGLHLGDLRYATRNGTAWEVSTVYEGSAGDAGQYSSLAIDPAGIPHISFNDGQHFSTLKYATPRDGGGWKISTIDADGFIGDTGYGSSLVMDPAGHPRVAYTSGKQYASLMYAANDGSSWKITDIDNGGSSTSCTGIHPSLALDSRGYPHVSYYQVADGDLRYGSWDGTGWVLETVDAGNDAGVASALAIGAGDRAHIAYYDATLGELKYATRAGSSGPWTIRTVDTGNDTGQYVKIALGPGGQPCLLYYDATDHVLRYVEWTGPAP